MRYVYDVKLVDRGGRVVTHKHCNLAQITHLQTKYTILEVKKVRVPSVEYVEKYL